jgi:hypothetical protein
MYRIFAVALALVAGISTVHAADDMPIKDQEQCNGIVKSLEASYQVAQASKPVDQLAEAEASIDALKAACEANDLVAAADHANSARQSLASEN